MRTLLLIIAAQLVTSTLFSRTLHAAAPSDRGPQPGEEHVLRLQAGVIVTANRGACMNLVAKVPVPCDWPEQQVRIVEEEISPSVKKVSYRLIDGSAKQMIVEIPHLAADEQARAIITFEVTRQILIAPDETDLYKVPAKRQLKRHVRPWLKPSPGIPSDSADIAVLAEEIVAGEEAAWEQAEAIHAWLCDNIKYEFDPVLRTAFEALSSRQGDCEELTSLFVALCRTRGIPARSVWVPSHCYPEFYLVDDRGQGHWFPCEATGPGAFGGIPEKRPILQKGDSFPNPSDPRERTRYLHGNLTGLPARNSPGQPSLEIVLEVLESPGE